MQVSGVLLDPSCSGSGTLVSRQDHLLPSGAARLRALQRERAAHAALTAQGTANIAKSSATVRASAPVSSKGQKRTALKGADGSGKLSTKQSGEGADGDVNNDSEAAGEAELERARQLAKFQACVQLTGLGSIAVLRASWCHTNTEQ